MPELLTGYDGFMPSAEDVPGTPATRQGVLLAAASFAVLVAVAFGWPPARRGETDFLSFYAGARLVGTPHLYSHEAANQIQREFANPQEVRAYIRPPFYAVLLWPLAQLPYRAAHAVWQLLNVAALGVFVVLWWPRPLAALVCCWFLPIWISFTVGQDMPLVLVWVSAALWLLRRKRDLAAGLVLALCAAKFHLFLLAPLLIVAKRLWRFGIGLLAGGASLAAVSFAVAGWNWPAQYLQLLEANEKFQASRAYMPNLLGLFHRMPHAAVWVGLLTVVVAAATWYAVQRTETDFALACTLAGSLLISPHAFYYDCAALLPLFLILAERASPGRSLAFAMLTGLSIPLIGQAAILTPLPWMAYEAYRRARRASKAAA